METLDLVVFVPIETEDRIRLSDGVDDGSGMVVDERLKELLLDDALGLGIEVIEVEGDLDERAGCVLRGIGGQLRTSRCAPRPRFPILAR